MDKKKLQLGMNPGTASGRLVKDLLFSFIKDNPCHRCGEELTRDTFSIEHIEPWLDSDDPVGKFFDLTNISYSHNKCNSAAASRPNKKFFSEEERAENLRQWHRNYKAGLPSNLKQERRRAQYIRTGK